MPFMKLTRKGFETYTGKIQNVSFVDGLSEDVSIQQIDEIAVAIAGDIVEVGEEGELTVVSEAGRLARVQRSVREEIPADPGARAGAMGIPGAICAPTIMLPTEDALGGDPEDEFEVPPLFKEGVVYFYGNDTFGSMPIKNLKKPTIQDPPFVGSIIWIDTDRDTDWAGPPSNLEYQWFADGVEIENADGSSLDLSSNQVGTMITCRVTAFGVVGNSVSVMTDPVGPVTEPE